MSNPKHGDGLLFGPEALGRALGLPGYEQKEVQIIVKGGWVQCVHNWPRGLPGAVYDYDIGKTATEARQPIEGLVMGGVTNPGYVLINTGAFDWLIARAMKQSNKEK